jgi:peptide/nickel transport system permease protein
MAVAPAPVPAGQHAAPPPAQPAPGRAGHPFRDLLIRRLAIGIVTLFVIAVLVFLATEVLPGNAARAALGRNATPAALHALEHQLGLDRSLGAQFWSWLSGILSGHLGASLANGQPVWASTWPRLLNSAVLVAVSGLIGSVVGILLGATAALRRDGRFDQVSSVVALAVTSLPEFVIAITLVILLATTVAHVLPAIALIPPGTYAWQEPKQLILPVITLALVIIPYIMRMTRAAMIEALESDYVEMARLKGVPERQVVLRHALPNAIAPIIQVIGLNFLYLAGGIVVVEYVFNFPGIGTGLVAAVTARDIPVIQLIVLILTGFYILMNILTDVIALAATPRRRIAR